MKTIPVYDNFDRTKQIGYMKLDMSKLPTQPNYHFALAGRVLDKEILPDGTIRINSVEITSVSAVPNKDFTDKV
ncbi:hypothetical protein LCGC14_1452180 [marine sediment metagenome]|uniref:Uncharacterized protein n=1 Tax=marine sediment metagenome TaxID=412755 RepID=A0A0F9K3X3_9ZZZZ